MQINMKQLLRWGILFGIVFVSFIVLSQDPIPVNEIKENPMRALWLRPKETTTEQVERHVQKIKDAGLNTAIESTAAAPISTIRQLLPYLDHYLMDIKHIDPNKHKEFTGKENTLMLENAKILAKEAKHLVIRVPVIPTFNDQKEEIAAICKYVSEIMPGGEINLLPYHRLGQDKYEALGRSYLMAHISPPSDEHMNELLKVAEGYGLKAKIGG